MNFESLIQLKSLIIFLIIDSYSFDPFWSDLGASFESQGLEFSPKCVCWSSPTKESASSFCCWQGETLQRPPLKRFKNVKGMFDTAAEPGSDLQRDQRRVKDLERKRGVCRSSDCSVKAPWKSARNWSLEREAAFGIQTWFQGISHKSSFNLVPCR